MEKKSEDIKSDDFQKGRPLLPRASHGGAKEAAKGGKSSKFGNDAIPEAEQLKDGAGIPPGYKPDTSVKYVTGKDGGEDHTVAADGTKTAVSAQNANLGGNVLPVLPEGHTYRDRVEAQAKSLGVEVVEGETLELLLWKIRMQASS